jgi:hypothetical protein
MSTATLGGARVTRARVQWPAWGLPWVDVDLDDATALVGAQTFVAAGASFSTTVLTGGVSDGVGRARCAFGGGGWGRELPRKGYANELGVKVANVLGDAATAVGETLAGTPSGRVGNHFARAAGDPASALLNTLAPRAWYVDADGVTRFGARAAFDYVEPHTRIRTDRARGIVEIAPESLTNVRPGMTVDGITATDVEIEVTPDRVTVTLFGEPFRSRRVAALGRIFDALNPTLRYRGVFDYRVVSQTAERLNVQPARVSTGMADLLRVPVRLAPGVKATWTPGSLCVVAFLDADPSRPVVIAADAADGPGWMPLALTLGDGVTLGVARLTDTVQAGPFAGVITGASARVTSGL